MDFGDTLEEDWLSRVESERKDCHCNWVKMYEVTIKEMEVFLCKRNSL